VCVCVCITVPIRRTVPIARPPPATETQHIQFICFEYISNDSLSVPFTYVIYVCG